MFIFLWKPGSGTDSSWDKDKSWTKLARINNGLTVDGGRGGVWTGIVSLPDIAALRRIEVGSGTLVAGELCGSGFTSGELEEIALVWRMAEMAVEPPLVKSQIEEGSDRSIVVRERFSGHVEPVNARMEKCCGKLIIRLPRERRQTHRHGRARAQQ